MAINLQKFCSTDLTRPYLLKPFSSNGFTYATNGHICIRIPSIAPADAPELAPAKACEAFFAKQVEFRPLPEINLPERDLDDEAVCDRCEGSGRLHDCPDCECICEVCGGTGDYQPLHGISIEIETAIYAARYIAMLQELPGIEIGPSHPGNFMRFRFDGGEGVLMPRRVRASIHIGPTSPDEKAEAAA